MVWQPISFRSIRDLAVDVLDKSLVSHEGKADFVWRGEPGLYKTGIVPRINRCVPAILTGATEGVRLSQEREWYDWWWERMLSLMLVRDVQRPTREDGLPELAWLNFAAHHGCHTRLVDWTQSPWVALYFACSRSSSESGRVWCFDTHPLQKRLEREWDDLGVERTEPGAATRDVAKAAFSPGACRWIVTQYNFSAPVRMAAQHGLFTLASLVDEPHDRLLDDFVPDGRKFQITIPSSFKPGLLDFLRGMGVHHESLQYPMLDQVAGDIAKEYPPK